MERPMPLKEWQHHVADTDEENKGRAWCGAWIVGFHFVDADHAALNGRNEGRTVPCPACRDAIIKALMNGAEDD